jgi:hypothetical protein
MRSRPRPTGRALTTSPFIREANVAPTTADFHVGDRVTLDSRGMGRVIEVTEEYVVVDFGTSGRGYVPAGTKGFSRL